MKKLMLALVCLASLLSGCASTAIKPTATYDAAWCDWSEIKTTEGDTIYAYNSPNGSLAFCKGADGKIVGVASGDRAQKAIEEAIVLLKAK